MKALLVRPRFDEPTEYTFAFATEILQWCQQAGIDTVELAEEQAVRERVEQALTEDIALFIFYDHGDENALIGQDEKAVIDLKNAGLLANKEVFTLACLSAKSLGVEVWRKGGKYWGYKEVVSFTTDALPEFKQAFNCGFHYRFIEGDTHQNTLKRAKETFDDLVFRLVDTGRTLAAICMRQNRDSLRYYNANPPDTDCYLRGILLRSLGLKRGWAIPSPIKILQGFF